jgi:alpha-mannosidase
VPLASSSGSGAHRRLPSSPSGVSVSRPGVEIAALRQKSNGKVALRLWELAGESGKVTVQLPSGSLVRIARLDLWTYAASLGPPIAVHAGSFEFLLSRFAPAAFELEQIRT